MLLLLLACPSEPKESLLDSELLPDSVDTVDTVCAMVVYQDADGDGFGDPESFTSACVVEPGYSSNDADCNDADAAIHPGSPEIPRDGVDQDCDGSDACVDLNCDGFLDIVLSIEEQNGNIECDSKVFIGSADGYNQTLLLPTIGAYANAIADLSGDGWPDIAFAGQGELRIYLGAPDDGFIESVVWEIGLGRALSAVDVDLDGNLDLVVADAGGPSKIFYGDGAGLSDVSAFGNFSAQGVAVGDLDGDGDSEVVFSDSEVGVRIFEQLSPRVFAESMVLPALGAKGVLVVDLDEDGFNELVVANSSDGVTGEVPSYVYWGESSGLSEENRTELPTVAAQGVTAADVDKDGYIDLVFSGGPGATSPLSHVYWGSPSRFSDGDHIELATKGAIGNTVADLDGDGWKDLVFGGTDAAEVFFGPSWPYNPSEPLPDSAGAVGVSAIAGEQGL
jgi:hypothetical protein